MEKNPVKDEGGGEYEYSKNGKVFDKVEEFFKSLRKFPKNFQKKYSYAEKDQDFGHQSICSYIWKSVIPAMHFNTRFISTKTMVWWGSRCAP